MRSIIFAHFEEVLLNLYYARFYQALTLKIY